jgi:hypothetical protein
VSDGPQVVECTTATQLPKGPLYCYVSPTLEGARLMHEAKRRVTPETVYHLKREWYFPVGIVLE